MMLRTARLTRGWLNPLVHHLLGAEPERLKGGLGGVYFPDQPDRSLDTADALLDATLPEPERLLNSRSGRLHLFPCVPADATVAFRDFQARGGFRVTAAREHGETTYVQITARRTVPCQLLHPWPGQPAHIYDGNREVDFHRDSTNGEGLVFEAEAGHTYTIRRIASGMEN